MKQNLMNSLMILSETIEELNRKFSTYKELKREQNIMQEQDAKAEILRLKSENEELKQSVLYEKDKNTRARQEIKNLMTELKNKI